METNQENIPVTGNGTSDAKIEANRENAKHSTGPRTNSGKVKASRNSIKHGLTAKEIFIAPGEEEEFRSFSTDLIAELNAVGPLEQDLARQLLHHAWGLRRLRAYEADLEQRAFADDVNPYLDEQYAPALARLAKYRAGTERAYKSIYRILLSLQTNRHIANSLMLRCELPGKPPALADLKSLPKRTQIPLHEFDNRMAVIRDYAGLGLDMHEIVHSELEDLAERFAKKYQSQQ